MYVQSCCFAYSKKLLILTRCRRPCGILKSLLFITFRQFLFAQIKLRFQIDCFPQWTLPVLGWYLTHLQSKGRELLKWRYVVKWVRYHTSRERHTTWKQAQRKHECHELDGESQFKEDKDWNKIKFKERMAIVDETQRWNSRSKILPREPYRNVPPRRVGFLRCFSLKMGIDFAHYILVWNQFWFSRQLRQCMNVFILSIPNE